MSKEDTGRHLTRLPSPPGPYALEVEDIHDTQVRQWAKGVEARLGLVHELAAQLKVVKWLAGALLGLGILFGAWLVRTTLLTEAEVKFLRADVARVERALEDQ